MDDQYYLQQAYLEAKKAYYRGEVPVGALIVYEGQIISRASNRKESTDDVTGHAEILAIRQASQVLGDWRLTKANLYTTLEPCIMCAGAIILSRISKVIYGAKDIRWGGAGSKVDLFGGYHFNHVVKVDYVSVLECSTIMKDFFKQRRSE